MVSSKIAPVSCLKIRHKGDEIQAEPAFALNGGDGMVDLGKPGSQSLQSRILDIWVVRIAGRENSRGLQRVPLKGSTESDQHINESSRKETHGRIKRHSAQRPHRTRDSTLTLPNSQGRKPHNLGGIDWNSKNVLFHCWAKINLISHLI